MLVLTLNCALLLALTRLRSIDAATRNIPKPQTVELEDEVRRNLRTLLLRNSLEFQDLAGSPFTDDRQVHPRESQDAEDAALQRLFMDQRGAIVHPGQPLDDENVDNMPNFFQEVHDDSADDQSGQPGSVPVAADTCDPPCQVGRGVCAKVASQAHESQGQSICHCRSPYSGPACTETTFLDQVVTKVETHIPGLSVQIVPWKARLAWLLCLIVPGLVVYRLTRTFEVGHYDHDTGKITSSDGSAALPVELPPMACEMREEWILHEDDDDDRYTSNNPAFQQRMQKAYLKGEEHSMPKK